MEGVTVVIPVGPNPQACNWLIEAVDSARFQTRQPKDILLIDDMHGLPFDWDKYGEPYPYIPFGDCRLWRAPWRLGVAHAFNMGVALADTECAILLGADDALALDAIEQCMTAYEHDTDHDSLYYALPVRYMDTGEEQLAACGAAMVTKSLWRKTGGFPPESSSGASDAAFISTFWNRPEICRVRTVGDRPLYNYRRHPGTDTAKRGPWQGVILETRNLVTQLWEPPNWGRFE